MRFHRTKQNPSHPTPFRLLRFAVFVLLPSLLLFLGLLSAQEADSPPAAFSVLDAHTGPASSAGVTPDGRILVTGGFDAKLKLWDFRTGEELQTLTGHQNLVLDLGIGPQGKRFASAGRDNVIKLWDLPAKDPESAWPGPPLPINDIVLRPDGQIAISVGEDQVVRVWDRQSGKLLQALEGHDAEILKAAFRADGNQWASGDRSGVLSLWTPGPFLDEDPTKRRSLHAHTDAISGIAYHPSNQLVLTGSRDGTVKQWQLNVPAHRVLTKRDVEPDAETPEVNPANTSRVVAAARNGQSYVAGGSDGRVEVIKATDGAIRELAGHEGAVRSLAVSPNSALVASGSETGAIKLWNLADGADRFQLRGHEGPIHTVAFHTDNSRLASAGQDGTVRLWKRPTAPQPLTGHEDALTALTISPNGQFLVSGGRNHSVRLWNASNGTAVGSGTGHLSPLVSAAFQPDSSQFATGDDSGVLRFWNGTNSAPVGVLGAHTASVNGIAWNPKGDRLVTTADDGTAKLWRLPLVAPRTLSGHTEAVNATALSSDTKLLATASTDETVRLFDLNAGKELGQLATQSGSMTAVAFSPDDAVVAAGSAEGSMLFRKTADGADLGGITGHEGRVTALDFNPTLPQIATAGADGTLRGWSVPKPGQPLTGHTQPITAAAVTADGKTVATASADQSLRLWNSKTGEALATLEGHEKPVQTVAFRPDSKQAASGDEAGLLRFWNVEKPEAGAVLGASDHPVRSLAYHPSGTQLLTGSEDGTMRLWRLPLSPPIQVPGHKAAVQAVAVTRDGQKIISGDAEGLLRITQQGAGAPPATVLSEASDAVTALDLNSGEELLASGHQSGFLHVWNMDKSEEKFRFQGHTGKVTDLAFHPTAAAANPNQPSQSPLMATTGEDGTLRIWNAIEPSQPLESFGQQVTGMVASRDGKWLATSGPINGRAGVVIRNLESQTKLATLLGHAGPIRSMQFNSDGTRIITGSEDQTARVWDLSDPKYPELVRFTGHATAVTAVALSTDGTLGISGSADKTLKVWKIADGSESHNLTGHSGGVVGLAVLDENTLISAGDTTVRFWTLSKGQQTRSLSAPAAVTSLALSPDGKQLIVGSAKNGLTAYHPANGQVLFEMSGHQSPVQSIAYRSDGKRIASRSSDGEYRLWDTEGRLRESFPKGTSTDSEERNSDSVYGVAFAGGSDTLLLTGSTGGLAKQKTALRHLIVPGETALSSAAFLPDGKAVLTAGVDKVVRLWNVADGSEVRQFSGPIDAVTTVAATPDGAQVIAGAADQTVRRWNVSDGKLLTTWKQPAAVRELDISRDGQRLAVSGDDSLVLVWDLATGKILQRFRGHEGQVPAVVFGQEAESLITGGSDQSVRVWPIAAQRVVVAENGPVKQVAFIGDGSQFAAIAGESPGVRIWSEEKDEATDLTAGEMPLESLAVHPDGSMVVAGGADQKVYRWTLGDAKPADVWEMPAAVAGLTYAQSEIKRSSAQAAAQKASQPRFDLLVAGADKRIRVLDAATGQHLETLDSEVSSPILAPVPKSRKVVTLGSDNSATIVERSLLQILDAHEGGVNDVLHSPDGSRILTGGRDGKIRVWNSETGQLMATLTVAAPTEKEAMPPAGSVGVTGIAVAANGRLLMASTHENAVQVWELADITDAAKPHAIFEHPSAVKRVQVSPDGRRMATLAVDNVVRVFDVERGYELERFDSNLPPEQSLVDLAFASDQKTVVATGTDKLIHVWQISAMRVWQAHEKSATAAMFLGEGDRFATCGGDGFVRIGSLKADDAQPVMELKAGTQALTSLVGDPEGTVITAAGLDKKLYSWTLADGKPLPVVPTPAPVTDLSLAGEPAKLAVAGADRSVRIYSPAKGRLLEEIRVPLSTPPEATPETEPPQTAPALRVALSPDGKRILVNAGKEGRVYSLSLLRLFEGHEGPATGAAFTADGLHLISGGADKTLRLWQVEDGALLKTWTAHDAEITSVAVSQDGKSIVSSSLDKTIRLWPVELPKAEAAMPEEEPMPIMPQAEYSHPATVRSVGFSADGSRVASACDDGFVRVWDVASSRELERFAGHAGKVQSVAFAPDNLRVVSGGWDGSVREWRISATRLLAAHPAAVTGLCYVGNGSQFVTAGKDGFVRLWDQNFNLVREFGLPRPQPDEPMPDNNAETGPVSAGSLSALAVRPDFQRLAAAVAVGEGETASGQILVWNLANGELLHRVSTPATVRRLDYSGDNLKLLCSSADETVRVYGTAEMEIQQEIPTGSDVRIAVFAPDSRNVLLGGKDHTVQTWRYVSPTAVRTLTGHGGSVSAVKFSPDGTRLASCSADGSIRIWNAATGQQISSLTGHEGAVLDLDFGSDGALLVSGGADSTVRLWDATGGRQLKQLAATEGAVYSVSFSGDGKRVATGGADKRVSVYDALSGALEAHFEKHEDHIYEVQFSPGSNRLMSCGYGGQLFVWNVADGEPVLERDVCRVAQSACYSPKGTRIVVTSSKGQVHVVDVPESAR